MIESSRFICLNQIYYPPSFKHPKDLWRRILFKIIAMSASNCSEAMQSSGSGARDSDPDSCAAFGEDREEDAASSATERFISDKESTGSDGDEDSTVLGESWDGPEQGPRPVLLPSPPPTPMPAKEDLGKLNDDPDIRWKEPLGPTRSAGRDKLRLRDRILSYPFSGAVLWIGLQLIIGIVVIANWISSWATIGTYLLGALVADVGATLAKTLGRVDDVHPKVLDTDRKPELFRRLPKHLSVAYDPRSVIDAARVVRMAVETALHFAGSIEYLSFYDSGNIISDNFERFSHLLAQDIGPNTGASVELVVSSTEMGSERIRIKMPLSLPNRTSAVKTMKLHLMCCRSSDRAVATARLGALSAGTQILWKQNPGGKWQTGVSEDPASSFVDPGIIFSPEPSFPDPDLIILFPRAPRSAIELLFSSCTSYPMELCGYPAWWLRIAEIVQVKNEDCTSGLILGNIWAGLGRRRGWVDDEMIWRALRIFDGREKREGK